MTKPSAVDRDVASALQNCLAVAKTMSKTTVKKQAENIVFTHIYNLSEPLVSCDLHLP